LFHINKLLFFTGQKHNLLETDIEHFRTLKLIQTNVYSVLRKERF